MANVLDSIQPLGKVVENLIDNWLIHFLVLIAYPLIIFGTQAVLLPVNRIPNNLSVTMSLMVIGNIHLLVYYFHAN